MQILLLFGLRFLQQPLKVLGVGLAFLHYLFVTFESSVVLSLITLYLYINTSFVLALSIILYLIMNMTVAVNNPVPTVNSTEEAVKLHRTGT